MHPTSDGIPIPCANPASLCGSYPAIATRPARSGLARDSAAPGSPENRSSEDASSCTAVTIWIAVNSVSVSVSTYAAAALVLALGHVSMRLLEDPGAYPPLCQLAPPVSPELHNEIRRAFRPAPGCLQEKACLLLAPS